MIQETGSPNGAASSLSDSSSCDKISVVQANNYPFDDIWNDYPNDYP